MKLIFKSFIGLEKQTFNKTVFKLTFFFSSQYAYFKIPIWGTSVKTPSELQYMNTLLQQITFLKALKPSAKEFCAPTIKIWEKYIPDIGRSGESTLSHVHCNMCLGLLCCLPWHASGVSYACRVKVTPGQNCILVVKHTGLPFDDSLGLEMTWNIWASQLLLCSLCFLLCFLCKC